MSCATNCGRGSACSFWPAFKAHSVCAACVDAPNATDPNSIDPMAPQRENSSCVTVPTAPTGARSVSPSRAS